MFFGVWFSISGWIRFIVCGNGSMFVVVCMGVGSCESGKNMFESSIIGVIISVW